MASFPLEYIFLPGDLVHGMSGSDDNSNTSPSGSQAGDFGSLLLLVPDKSSVLSVLWSMVLGNHDN